MAIKDAQDALSRVSEHGRSLSGKLEDLVFRAQRIARALKNGTQVPDSLFGRDLKEFRLDIRGFGTELSGLPSLLAGIAQPARIEPGAAAPAEAISLLSQQIHNNLLSLEDQCQLASQHIRGAEYKSDMGHLFAEVHGLIIRVQDLPAIIDKIASQAKASPLNAPAAVQPLPASAPVRLAPACGSANPAPNPRRAVPLRSIARFSPAPPSARPPAQPDGPEHRA